MNEEIKNYYATLSNNEIQRIEIESEEMFDYAYSDKVYKMHKTIEEYSNKNGLQIYDKVKSSYNLLEFIKDNSTALDKIFIDNIKNEYNDNKEEEDENDYECDDGYLSY